MSDKDDVIPEAERLVLALEQLSLSDDNKSEGNKMMKKRIFVSIIAKSEF